jgi:hypothetical protein
MKSDLIGKKVLLNETNCRGFILAIDPETMIVKHVFKNKLDLEMDLSKEDTSWSPSRSPDYVNKLCVAKSEEVFFGYIWRFLSDVSLCEIV